MWEKFDDSSMGIVVRHIRRLVLILNHITPPLTLDFSCSLPDSVYDPGERPAKLPQKRTKVSLMPEFGEGFSRPKRKGPGKSNTDIPNKRQRLVSASKVNHDALPRFL